MQEHAHTHSTHNINVHFTLASTVILIIIQMTRRAEINFMENSFSISSCTRVFKGTEIKKVAVKISAVEMSVEYNGTRWHSACGAQKVKTYI